MKTIKKNVKTLPLGIKLISILQILIAGLFIIFGIIWINTIFKGVAVILLVLGAIGIALSIFLLKKKNWARIAFGIIYLIIAFNYLASIPFLFSFGLLYTFFTFLLISLSGFLSYYFLLNNNVKEAFKST
jgi:hypothetical protein